MISRGDILDVLVQEVDKERDRIGLELVAKHEPGTLVLPEELIERAKAAPPRESPTAIASCAAAAAGIAARVGIE